MPKMKEKRNIKESTDKLLGQKESSASCHIKDKQFSSIYWIWQ